MIEKICHAQKHLSECAPPVRIIKNRTLNSHLLEKSRLNFFCNQLSRKHVDRALALSGIFDIYHIRCKTRQLKFSSPQ